MLGKAHVLCSSASSQIKYISLSRTGKSKWENSYESVFLKVLLHTHIVTSGISSSEHPRQGMFESKLMNIFSWVSPQWWEAIPVGSPRPQWWQMPPFPGALPQTHLQSLFYLLEPQSYTLPTFLFFNVCVSMLKHRVCHLTAWRVYLISMICLFAYACTLFRKMDLRHLHTVE